LNILAAPPSEAELTRILAGAPRTPLLPPLASQEWTEAARVPMVAAWLARLRELATTEAAQPLPVLDDALYGEFHRSGERLSFERPYFERRRRLARAAVCALLDPPGRAGWIESLVAKTRAIYAEPSWALPACTRDPSGKEPHLIDLFAAETANLMAELDTVFGEYLPTDLRTAIRHRLSRMFDEYLERPQGCWWRKASHNWNAVCHQGILGAALALEEDPGRLARLLLLAADSLPTFLDGFTADGGTSEGPGYWGYGFGWFSVLNEQLERRSGDALSLIEGNAKISLIARFAVDLSFADGHLVNFSDGSATGRAHPARLDYLGQRLDIADCRALAATNYRHLAEAGIDPHNERCDVFYLLRLILRAPAAPAAAPYAPPPDRLLPDLAVVVARTIDHAGRRWEFAAKAGHNAEHHNHNDCGSFILNLNACRGLIEIGAPEYTRDYFRAQRYESLAARSLGHSVPLIGGCEQAAGREHAARMLTAELHPDVVLLAMELAACYPASAGCRSCIRTFRFDKQAGALAISDQFELDGPRAVESALIVGVGAVRDGDGVRVPCGDGALRIVPGPDCAVTAIEPHHYHDHKGRPSEIRRIVLRPLRESERCEISCTVIAG